MEYIFDNEKPDLEDLVHFGVKGMHWGVRRAARKERHAETNRIIDEARAARGEKKQAVKDAKAKFKSDRTVANLNALKNAKLDRRVNETVASTYKHGKETTAIVLAATGLVAFSALRAFAAGSQTL